MSALQKDLFIKTFINIKESINPNSIINKADIEQKLLSNIKKRLGDKCSKYGYIQKNTIKIIDRTLGEIISSHFNGKLVYNIKLEVTICSPSKDDIISCRVIAKNKIGILCQSDPLVIILSKDYHNKNSKFDSIQENDTIHVKIIDYKYKYSDNQIQVVGALV